MEGGREGERGGGVGGGSVFPVSRWLDSLRREVGSAEERREVPDSP